MSNNFALHLSLNNLSFGQVSFLILREIFNKKLTPSIFTIGQADISSQSNVGQDFALWLQECINKANKDHNRNNPVLKLWHFNGSMESVSNKQTLLSFYECDSPTPEEINIVRNNHKVILTNDYSVNIFKDFGCDNVKKVKLGFDKYNFKTLSKKYFEDDRISFILPGKMEVTRKRSVKAIQAWLKHFGNNPNYFLNCAIWNQFINPEQQKQMYSQIVGPNKVGNIQFLGFQNANEVYNDILNSNDICISMGTEGWGLPAFTSLCLGKEAVLLNAAGHKEFATENNSVLVNPSNKIPIYDGLFFHQGQPFNQGNCFDFNEEDFVGACYKAIERVKTNRKNKTSNLEGEKLVNELSSEKMVDNLLAELL